MIVIPGHSLVMHNGRPTSLEKAGWYKIVSHSVYTMLYLASLAQLAHSQIGRFVLEQVLSRPRPLDNLV
jgi:hypothetical protein